MSFARVAHLYIGCKVMRPDNKTILELYGVMNGLLMFKENGEITYGDPVSCKPILFPLNTMDDSQKEVCDGLTKIYKVIPYQLHGELVKYLLSERFDLFHLIKSGDAIDATILYRNPY